MAFEPYTRVDFGPLKAGLPAVGYTLVRAGRPIGPRVTRGVEDLGKGQYGAAVVYPSHFRGQLAWDSGGPSPQVVVYEVTPEHGAVLAGPAAAVKKAVPAARRAAPRVRVAPGPPPAPAADAFLEACEPPPAAPVVGTIDTLPVAPRLRTVVVRAGQCPTVAWTMLDADGCPLDLTACEPGPQAMVLGTLRIAPDCYNYIQDFPAVSPDPAAGLMVAEVDPAQMGGPGLYVAEMAVLVPEADIFDPTGPCVVAASNQFYLAVETGLFGLNYTRVGPPSLAEIRLELRDSSPLENDLLDDSVAFDTSEIVVALRNVVDYWNESLPPIAPYTTQNFPFRYWWKRGAKAQLFWIAAEWHRKNQAAYSAGGVSFDEHGQKAQQYDQAAQTLWNEYRQWAQQKKISINLDQGWGEFPSPYSRFGAW
jgi:hypothetical protein